MTLLQQKTYTLLKLVPKGKVTTYKALATALHIKAYRVIGRYMKLNPYPYMSCTDTHTRVPCHRVVASDGSIGGFMGKKKGKEIQLKISLLKNEGVTVHANKIDDFSSRLYTFME